MNLKTVFPLLWISLTEDCVFILSCFLLLRASVHALMRLDTDMNREISIAYSSTH